MKRPLKYRNKPTIVDGIRFASKAEARWYGMLKLRERAEEIKDLELQPKFECYVNGMKICTYFGDFKYFDLRDRVYVIDDVKGIRTSVYKIKKKLVEAIHGVTITEVAA